MTPGATNLCPTSMALLAIKHTSRIVAISSASWTGGVLSASFWNERFGYPVAAYGGLFISSGTALLPTKEYGKGLKGPGYLNPSSIF